MYQIWTTCCRLTAQMLKLKVQLTLWEPSLLEWLFRQTYSHLLHLRNLLTLQLWIVSLSNLIFTLMQLIQQVSMGRLGSLELMRLLQIYNLTCRIIIISQEPMPNYSVVCLMPGLNALTLKETCPVESMVLQSLLVIAYHVIRSTIMTTTFLKEFHQAFLCAKLISISQSVIKSRLKVSLQ